LGEHYPAATHADAFAVSEPYIDIFSGTISISRHIDHTSRVAIIDICIPCSKHDRQRTGDAGACADRFTHRETNSLSHSRSCRRARPVARNGINYRDHLCRSRSLIVRRIIRRKSRRGSENLIALNECAAVPARHEFLFVIRSGRHDYSAAGGQTHD
jgi:hypothetical protein